MTAPRLKAAPLTAPTVECGPYLDCTAARRSAISSRASSQDICSHSPLPRDPMRRIGCNRRFPFSVHSRTARTPFTQNAPFEPGCFGLGPIFATLPSRMVISEPQYALHSQHWLGCTMSFIVTFRQRLFGAGKFKLSRYLGNQ